MTEPMALASTLYDFQIVLSNVDRSIDQQLSFKLPRHPSETMERVWLKVLAFCWLWEERLTFGPGLGDPEAPDLETRDYTNVVKRWVRVGRAEPVKVQRAVDQNGNGEVCVLFEAPARMESFLAEAAAQKVHRVAKARLAAVDGALLKALGERDERRVKVGVTLVGDHFYLDFGGESLDGPLTHAPTTPA